VPVEWLDGVPVGEVFVGGSRAPGLAGGKMVEEVQ
jgi:hypothetical protein